MDSKNVPTIFNYEHHEVRTILIDGEIWFVGKDVCEILGISKYRDALARLDEGEGCPVWVDTLGGKQEMGAINEPGLYRLIFRSDKPVAKRFQDWVYKEVLPSIRKTGSYAVAEEWTPDIETDPHKLALAIRCERAKLSYLQAVRALHYPELVVRQHAKQLAAPKPDKNAPDYIEAEIVRHLGKHGSLTLNTLKHSYMKRCDEVSLQRHLNTLIAQGIASSTDTSYGTKRYSLVVSQEA